MTEMTVLNGVAIEELLTIPMAVVRANHPSVAPVPLLLGVSPLSAIRPGRLRISMISISSAAGTVSDLRREN